MSSHNTSKPYISKPASPNRKPQLRHELSGIQDYNYEQVESQDQRIDLLSLNIPSKMNINRTTNLDTKTTIPDNKTTTSANKQSTDLITQAENFGNFQMAETLAFQFHKLHGTCPPEYAYLQAYPDGNAEIVARKKQLKEAIWAAEAKGDREEWRFARMEWGAFIWDIERLKAPVEDGGEGMDVD